MPPPDDSQDAPTPSTVNFPTSVKVAGMIWIGAGLLGLIQITVLFASDQLARGGGLEGCGACCFCGSTNLFFLAIGYETTSWRIRWSTAANAAVSIVVGWAYAAQAVLIILAPLQGRPIDPLQSWLLGGTSALMSIALVVAGVLAMVGWRHYSRSRAGQRLSEKSEEETDFDDLSAHPPDDDED